MRFLRQNIRSMITVAVFAILAAIVEGSFACDYGFESRQESGFADAAFGKVEAPDNPLFLSRETGAEISKAPAGAIPERSGVPHRSPAAQLRPLATQSADTRPHLHTKLQKSITFLR